MNKRIKKKKAPTISLICSPLALDLFKNILSYKKDKQYKYLKINISTEKCLDYETWYLMRG